MKMVPVEFEELCKNGEHSYWKGRRSMKDSCASFFTSCTLLATLRHEMREGLFGFRKCNVAYKLKKCHPL